MSHIKTSSAIAKDIECLKRSVALIPGLTWAENQQTYEWWGRWENDYSGADAAYVALGIKPEDYGKCAHAIKVDGSKWEIGVVKRPDGKGYALVFDDFGRQGQAILKRVGAGSSILMSEYAKEYVRTYARSMRMTVREQVNAEGNTVITMTRY